MMASPVAGWLQAGAPMVNPGWKGEQLINCYRAREVVSVCIMLGSTSRVMIIIRYNVYQMYCKYMYVVFV